jgi:maltose alpha-D-glucosyltransferase / alpha-amylase
MTRGPEAHPRAGAVTDEPTWYKDAIIYEVRTRSFFDSNDDGIGDLRGLASKLDYLQDLGITALWILPFYPSPGKDDGYDISGYTDVHPDVGTLADFELLLEEAHRRGIRVITELVLNHTSDQHPWFRRARRAPPGSAERDFYVWGDSPGRYPDARIIFTDFEVSNWSWDREANAYYWHRFYAHQPDLNFENPAVHDALLEVVDFWLAKGVDGLRLDAVPYLYEEEGTNCENLPQTHAFLKKLRAHVDAKFHNRLLLAEANQWPEDAAAYFGRGDECHMNFHFPLMPRMFMAIHQEDRFPIVDIFAQTPDVHPTCQWALFLRNHDELTLEMVTDEERDYMYRAYADQAAMRINLGIRRRLAPLVGNSRRKMELLNGLLFSLPGTPVLYYGDEIGMGDNVYLGDRNGVRTPMQWSTDRNAGFSRANPQRLILPVIIDPEYHYESVNVENQQQNPTSFLWWMKRLVAFRKRFAAFGRGSTEFLSPHNSRVLAFVRQARGETILVVANLSRFTQYAELDLSKHKGMTPVELFGKTKFPAIGDGTYMLTLGPHGFYWFSFERPAIEDERLSMPPPPSTIECTSLEALLFGRERPLLDDALPTFLEGRPWFAGRNRSIQSVQVTDVVRAAIGAQVVYIVFVRAEYAESPAELYVVPLVWVPADRPPPPGAALAFVRIAGEGGDSVTGVLIDALDDPPSARALLDAIARRLRFPGRESELVASTVGDLVLSDEDRVSEPHRMGAERDNTTVRFGERFVLKLLRRLDEGVSTELDVGSFLTTRGSEFAPRLCGALELVRPRAEPMTVAVLYAYVPHASTAWQFTLEELGRYYDRVLARSASEPCPPPPRESPMLLAAREPPPIVSQMIGSYRDAAAQLGVRVAALHLALASNEGDPAFAPEPYSALDRRSKYQSLRNLSGKVFRMLRLAAPSLPPVAQREAEYILAREGDVLKSFEPLLRAKMSAVRIRVHGNLDLDHVLYTGKDFVLTGFHGFGALTLAERRRKRSPLRDLAWMTRSFEFAAFKLLLDPASVRESDVDAARSWALQWTSWASASFIRAYLEATTGAVFIPAERDAMAVLFDAFALEGALYQLRGELEERSPAVTISLLGIAHILAGSEQMASSTAP